MRTSASLFTGGGLFDVGARAAGYEPIWGLEKFDKIASVARLNGLPVTTVDVINVDFSELQRPNHLHASPPCLNFSVANASAVETELDIAMASTVCSALSTLQPDTFTLENVIGYRHSRSFGLVTKTLNGLGYWWDVQNLNSADFGVPQSRIRLIVRASKKLLQGYPAPVEWRGWYQAIEDLIPSLPDTEFAPWQIARLPKEYKEFMLGQGTRSPVLETHEPAQTITANRNQNHIKAFLFAGAGNTNIAEAQPGKGVRYEASPAHTVASDDNEPIFTQISNAGKQPIRAYIGRVVKMDVRALGRFQTVPDSYQGLTVKINGNGFPCLFAQKILETL